jgi:hypothetical protein
MLFGDLKSGERFIMETSIKDCNSIGGIFVYIKLAFPMLDATCMDGDMDQAANAIHEKIGAPVTVKDNENILKLCS